MRVLVTGSSGHLGVGLVTTLPGLGHEVIGLDRAAGATTDLVGSITDRELVRRAVDGVDAVLHTATLHKPHVATHSKRDFVTTNVEGTLALLEEAAAAGVGSFVFTSTTSSFGRAMNPAPGDPAVWVTEDLVPIPKNIYGVTKVAAEHVAELVHHDTGLPVVVLRTSRFFPEDDDEPHQRAAFDDANLKVNELLNRRVDLVDVVSAHVAAMQRAPELGFGRYIVSATTPFRPEDAAELVADPAEVVERRVPGALAEYERRGWSIGSSIDRVYVNERARRDLGWQPTWDFASAIEQLRRTDEHRSPLAIAVGSLGYHGAMEPADGSRRRNG